MNEPQPENEHFVKVSENSNDDNNNNNNNNNNQIDLFVSN